MATHGSDEWLKEAPDEELEKTLKALDDGLAVPNETPQREVRISEASYLPNGFSGPAG